MDQGGDHGGSPEEGYVPIYEVPLQFAIKDASGRKILKSVVFKICIRQTDDVLQAVHFQISDDKELDFLYESTYTAREFQEMKTRQSLEIDFVDFPNVVRQLVANVVRQGERHDEVAEYEISFKTRDDPRTDDDLQATGPAEEDPRIRYFIIYQRLEFCRVPISKLRFTQCDDWRAGQISQRRYDELSAKLKAVETEFKDIYKRLQRQAPKILSDFKPAEPEK
jgi:hypothetical protein